MSMARQMFEGLHSKVEPELDTINTEDALDRVLENVLCATLQELKVLA